MDAPDRETLVRLAELFRVFGDPTRVQILTLLAEQAMCVGEIAGRLDMSQSAISHQLRGLKNARLVKPRREGKAMVYALADDHVKTILAQGLEHICE